MGCQGTARKPCYEATKSFFRVSVLDAGRERTGIYCRSHASCAVVRAAFNGQRVVVVRNVVPDPPSSTASAYDMPGAPVMVSGDTSDRFAEADSLTRR